MSRCEAMAKKIPGIRAAVAKELASMGMTQEQIAQALGISQGAVSQYITRQRGRMQDEYFYRFVKDISVKISKHGCKFDDEICILCNMKKDI